MVSSKFAIQLPLFEGGAERKSVSAVTSEVAGRSVVSPVVSISVFIFVR